jgi:hypothetical protein
MPKYISKNAHSYRLYFTLMSGLLFPSNRLGSWNIKNPVCASVKANMYYKIL